MAIHKGMASFGVLIRTKHPHFSLSNSLRLARSIN
jgi:hypothetical protein